MKIIQRDEGKAVKKVRSPHVIFTKIDTYENKFNYIFIL